MYEADSVENKVCDSLEVVCSCKFDDDSTLLLAFRDGDARVVRVGQGRHNALSQCRQGFLLAGARAWGGLDLADSDDLFSGAH